MDPVSAIGLASSILTFIDIGYKVVAGTLETAQIGRAPHTEHIDAVARDLDKAVARFGKPVSPNASDPEKALWEVSVRCQTLSTELLALLGRFKVQAAKPGISWDTVKVVIRRIRSAPKVQELQRSLAEYRSQILVHLVTILAYVTLLMPIAVRGWGIALTIDASDRQLATQTQLGVSVGETQTDLRGIRDALGDVRTVLDKLEQDQMRLRPTTRPIPDTDETPGPLAEQSTLSDKLSMQFQEVKDALDRLTAGHSEKTPETRILEHVYFGASMFQREETLRPADAATFRWFVEGVPSKDGGENPSVGSKKRKREEAPPGLHIGAQKAEVASRFQNWLRSGNGVFHISGKAGSGKSTLMKLILSTERTYELLREWTGGRRLLFARFYFWAGGDQMQNSLEGLQRSILFEILIKRPDLVNEVFREAYQTVACSNWDSSIQSRFFTTAGIQKAFERLLMLPADPRYRLCLFIDGLDEFGADGTSGSLPETEREDLAQSLIGWARNDHFKILVSSRPHPEFTETFAEDQRIHLHQLTYDDMIEFGHHLFERHRVFAFSGVKERYHSLVKMVANASDGVFLWTGLTIQKMLASLARRDSFESVEKQLEATPRDLNLLYQKMFSAIDENERRVAMKMMLLVSEERKYLGDLSHPRGVNAMAISWLESLEDPEFPANQPFVVYNHNEIEEKRQFAEARLSGYTRGLLEVITYIPESNHDGPQASYLRHTVQFFHRTALDYVTTSPLARDVLSSSPELFNLEFYIRLSLTELHFGSLLDGDGRGAFGRYPNILKIYLSTPKPSHSLIEAYKAALEQQARHFPWPKAYLSLNGFGQFSSWFMSGQSTSFDHWVANEVQETFAIQYLTERIQILPDLPHPQDGLSLLLSAACWVPGSDSTNSRSDLVKLILALGADLNHVTNFLVTNLHLAVGEVLIDLSVWQAWCLYYVTAIVSRHEVSFLSPCNEISNRFLVIPYEPNP